ncbi:hypothetical protein [Mediterraneibacter agrestimuris]|uniref:hypothetical protein n=1 Tax=Mediterraneibacter agrestimuris TaxID=2941333 RepID=UPI00203ADDAF|nr:hypothetical protein [Mediterraneibacter agrestimuris]
MEGNTNTVNNQEPQQTVQTGERTFTQDEVNRIVQERLARAKTTNEPDQRELDLQKRERALYVREAVANAGLDKELADEFAGLDKETVDKCLKIIAPYAQKMKEPILNAVGPTGGNGFKDDDIRRAMGLKV